MLDHIKKTKLPFAAKEIYIECKGCKVINVKKESYPYLAKINIKIFVLTLILKYLDQKKKQLPMTKQKKVNKHLVRNDLCQTLPQNIAIP